jgi:hypothetical protein
MNKQAILFVFFIVISYTTNNAQEWFNQDACNIRNVRIRPDTTPGSTWIYPTIFNWHNEFIETPGVNSGVVGAMYFDGKYYLNCWNSNKIFRYTGGLNGPVSFFDSITYVGGIRDLTTDGQYLYGGAASNIVYKLNPDGSTAGTITLGSPAVARAIAYNPDEKGFFVCNFNDNIILCNAKTGAVIRTLYGTSSLPAKYGLAYSFIPYLGETLWVWGQGSVTDPYNNLWILNPETGSTIATYRFGPLPIPQGISTPGGLAGGAEICIINNSFVLLLNFQNYALIGYNLGQVVPVELISFRANSINNGVTLYWSTATENNNRGFEVQRSSSDGLYRTIAFVNGAGTSTEIHNYLFTDKKLLAGKFKYRLRQVDYDGNSEFSKTIEVEVPAAKFNLFQNYPNPFNPVTTITFSLPADSRVTLKIYNLIGQELMILVNGDLSAGMHSFDFDAAKYASGIYFCRLEVSDINESYYSFVRKMILNK